MTIDKHVYSNRVCVYVCLSLPFSLSISPFLHQTSLVVQSGIYSAYLTLLQGKQRRGTGGEGAKMEGLMRINDHQIEFDENCG